MDHIVGRVETVAYSRWMGAIVLWTRKLSMRDVVNGSRRRKSFRFCKTVHIGGYLILVRLGFRSWRALLGS